MMPPIPAFFLGKISLEAIGLIEEPKPATIPLKKRVDYKTQIFGIR